MLAAGCEMGGQPAAAPVPTTAPSTPSGPSASPTAAVPDLVHVFSNSPPHIIEINTVTNQIVRTKDVPNLGVWATNDDNCYWDGTNVWLGARNPSTSDVEVFLLNITTLEVGTRIPLGKDTNTVYIGKGSLRTNQLWIAKHGSSEVAVVDTNTRQVLEIKSVPTNGGVACDMDVATGPDGVERAYIPTNNGDTTFSINTTTRQVETVYEHTKGVSPYMLTASPDGRYVWVQERTTDGNLVLDGRTLQPVKHVPTGRGAFVNTFSPDGRLCYVSHSQDTRMVVVEANPPFNHVKDIEVGTNAQVTAALANGRTVYTIANREASVAAINTSNWAITAKVALPENPAFVWARFAARR